MAVKTVVAVMTDLFFLVQVTAAAKPLGLHVVCVRDKATALEKVQAGAAALVVDFRGVTRQIEAKNLVRL